MGYLFNCLHLVEPVLGTRGSFGAALSQKVGAGAQATCGGPGAVLSREAGAGATRTRGGPRATPSWEVGAGALGHTTTRAHLVFCLDLELARGGTRSSGYRQWPCHTPVLKSTELKSSYVCPGCLITCITTI
jgi:hypothetical protein